MKINKRQEVAMWILGLLWTGFAYIALGSDNRVLVLLPLVPIGLVLFSLRDRKKPSS